MRMRSPAEIINQNRRELLSTAVVGIAAAAFAALLPAGAKSAATNETIRPFRINVPENDLVDLRRRLSATRWPDRETVSDLSQGAQLDKLEGLVRYWETGYDWRKLETRLNALPQFMTEIDGVDIHFIHVRSRHPNALPLIMTHGWPGSIVELLKTVGPLTDPTAHGGRAEDAFDLVLPSMPGYGFSGKPTGPGWGPDQIARAWAELMKRLGYARYVSQGGDWGAVVAESMGRQAPAGLAGIHVNLPAAIPANVAAALATGTAAPAGLTDKERSVFDSLEAAAKKGNRAYFVVMAARPQAIGYGLTDSPAGLAAWLLVHPGFAKWTYGTDLNSSPTRDDVLDDISLYWLTRSATSSARLYWENGARNPISAAAQKTAEILLPVAVTVFPDESYRAPETWVRNAYPNLIYFNEVNKGGHFAAWEQPELFSAELRAAFKPLRQSI